MGDENSAKTQTVLQAGLDPELIAGNVFQDGGVVPTSLANVWLTGSAALVEAGGPLLKQPPLWKRFVQATVPSHLGSALSSNSKLPARAIVVCVSIERILAPSTAEQIKALAQTLNERLRELSQILGISLPVYVLFTKLDTMGSFSDFAVRLSEEEVKFPVGSLLSSIGAGSGLYAERAARFDRLEIRPARLRALRVSPRRAGTGPRRFSSRHAPTSFLATFASCAPEFSRCSWKSRGPARSASIPSCAASSLPA